MATLEQSCHPPSHGRMRVPIAAQFLWGLFCLNGALVCEAEIYHCLDLKKVTIKTGDIITTKRYGGKLWCGSQEGKFLALSNTKLVYLKCSPDAGFNPKEATVTIFDVRNLSYRSSEIIFDSTEQCFTTRRTPGQADGLTALANRLSGVTVPYDCSKCNAQHYFEYLLQSHEGNAAADCPVFSTFTDAKSVESKVFQLADKNSLYNWPATSRSWLSNSKRTLTIAEVPRWKPQSTYSSGSMRGSKGNVSGKGLGRRGSRNATNASRTQKQIDTVSRYRGGGAGTGGGTGGNPIGTGGKTPGSYPWAGAYPYSHPRNSPQKSAAPRPAPPLILSTASSAVWAGLKMIGG